MVTIIEGQNELNVTLIRVPDIIFGTPTGQLVGCYAAPAFKVVDFYCDVTNASNVAINRQFKVVLRYKSLLSGNEAGPFTLISAGMMLEPGQTKRFTLLGNYMEGGVWYAYFTVGTNMQIWQWLEDEFGNKSSELTLARG